MARKSITKRIMGGFLTGVLILSGIPAGAFAESDDGFEAVSEAEFLPAEGTETTDGFLEPLSYGTNEAESHDTFDGETFETVESVSEAEGLADEIDEIEDFILDEDPVLEVQEDLFEEEGSGTAISDPEIGEQIIEAENEEDVPDNEVTEETAETVTEESSVLASPLDPSEMASATTVTVGTSFNVKAPNEEDVVYKFTPTEKAVYTIHAVTNGTAPSYTELYFSLYDADGNWIGNGYEEDSDYEDIVRILSASSVYYLRIDGYWSGTDSIDYNITISKRAGGFFAQAEGETEREVSPSAQVPLTVTAVSDTPENITYSWTVDDDVTPVCTTATYIYSATKNASITCRVSDGTNTEYLEYQITIANGFEVYADESEWHSATMRIAPSSSVELKPFVKGNDLDGLTYEWSGGISSTASSVTVSPSVYTSYRCTVTDKYGNSDYARYRVYIENNLVAYPKGATLDDDGLYSIYSDPNATLTLEVIATATDSSHLSYQWYDEYDDEEPIPSATQPSYRFTYAGGYKNYYCEVTDQYNNRVEAWFSIIPKLNISNAGVITENAKTTVSNLPTEEERVFSFTPQASSAYVIYSVEPVNNYIYLYDDSRTVSIAENERGKKGFCLQYNFVAGKTYYARIGAECENNETKTFNIMAAKVLNGVIQTPGQGTEKTPNQHVHAFGAWTLTKAPSALATGAETRTCSCGASETREVAKLQPTMNLNVSGTIPMKVRQTSRAVTVTGLASGDSVQSVSSDETNILKVSLSGNTLVLKAQKKKGTATVTVRLASGLGKTFKVKVQKGTVKAKKISVASKKVTLKKGKTFDLMVSLTPVTTQSKISYSTSNKKVATVTKKGVIKAKGKGKATVTVKSGNKKVKIKVTVKQ